jgi:hypothetical protein
MKAFFFLQFFFLLLFSFISISGFGVIFSRILKNNINYQQSNDNNFFNGILLLLPICYLKIFFFNTNILLSIFIFLIGIFFYFKKFEKSSFLLELLITLIFFIGIIISKTHEDFLYYHLQYIREISSDKFIFGLAVADIKYFYGSSIAYLQSMYLFESNKFNFIHIPIFLFYLSTLIFFLKKIFLEKIFNIKFYFSIFVLMVLIFKFKRLSEFGYDYIYHFIFFYIFYEFFLKKNNNIFILSSFCLLLFSIKPISILLIPFYIFFIVLNFNFFFKNFDLKKIIFIFIFGSIILMDSFIKSGCLLIPSKITCLDKSVVWTIDYNDSNLPKAKSWARGYYHQDINFTIKDEKVYNSNFNWTKNWFSSHFKYKVSEYIYLLLFIFLLLIIFNNKNIKKSNFNIKHKTKILSLISLSFFSLVLWFLYIPQFRFGISQITILFILIFYYFFNFRKNIKFLKEKLIFLISFSIIFYNISNYNRIKNEFDRNDKYKFVNFPFINNETVNHVKKISGNFYYYYAPNSPCINSLSVCSTKNIIINKYKNVIILQEK